MNVNTLIIYGGGIKYIQASDMCWNKPFKARLTKLYDQWLSEGVRQFTEDGNKKPSSKKRIIELVLDNWSQLSKENTSCCDFNLANYGTEYDSIHCLKKGQPYKTGEQKSQLSVLFEE